MRKELWSAQHASCTCVHKQIHERYWEIHNICMGWWCLAYLNYTCHISLYIITETLESTTVKHWVLNWTTDHLHLSWLRSFKLLWESAVNTFSQALLAFATKVKGFFTFGLWNATMHNFMIVLRESLTLALKKVMFLIRFYVFKMLWSGLHTKEWRCANLYDSCEYLSFRKQ